MKRDIDKITVEDLLRLKRAERPPADFWSKFESEMRAKQLAAIVSRRPWWDGIARGFSAVRRLQLPMGAAAALALTWVGVHYAGSRTPVIQNVASPAARPAKVFVAVAPAPAKPAAIEHEVADVVVADVSHDEAPVIASTSSHIVQAPPAAPAAATSASPFADGIAVTLADYRSVPSDLPRMTAFGSDRDFEPSVTPARQVTSEPLARMDPAEERRSRLLAPALSTGPRAFASDWMKERASSNDRMYESMDDGHSSGDRALVGFRF